MTDEELRRISGWVAPFRPAPGESLDSAWDRCPDARFLLGVAIEAGARPRAVTRGLVGCIRALLPELWDEPPWRGALYVAEAYGRGEMDAEALRQLLPSPREAQKTAEWSAAAERALAQRSASPQPYQLAARSALFALAALHPDTPPRERVTASSVLLESLASLGALAARTSAHRAGAEMLEQHRRSGGGGVPILILPPHGSGAWDEAAQRAYAHGLRLCADAVRASVDKPWKVSGK